MRTEYTPIDLTRTLFDFLSRALNCASALGRIRRLHALHLLTAARQTSIVLTTAPPAPAFLHEYGDRISRACYSRLRVLHSFHVTPILELIAVRVDRPYQKFLTTTPLKVIAGIVTHPLAFFAFLDFFRYLFVFCFLHERTHTRSYVQPNARCLGVFLCCCACSLYQKFFKQLKSFKVSLPEILAGILSFWSLVLSGN